VSVEYPKLLREERLDTKLLDPDIAAIQARRRTGETYASIAADFQVSASAIYYWCLDEEQRKSLNKSRKRKPTVYDAAYHRAHRARKIDLHPEMIDYERFSSVRYKNTHPDWRERKNKAFVEKYNSDPSFRAKVQTKNQAWIEKHGGAEFWNEYHRKLRARKRLVG